MAGINPSPTVEVLCDAKAEVGEGPYYEQESNQLLWVDIYKHTINFLNPDNGENRSLHFSETVSAVIPVEGSNQLLALLAKKICLVDRKTGDVRKELGSVEADKPAGNRFNDAKCDSTGRLWCGTMGQETSPGVLGEATRGALYSYNTGSVKTHVPASISNGIGWNLADNIMYYIDSAPKKVYTFNFNKQDGSLSNQQVFTDFALDESLALPDGMCMDTKGRLWIASFGGGCITCWDPHTKQNLVKILIPGAKRITSCCFGGPDYGWLFVTSATYGANEKELVDYPHSGAVFIIKDLGARGSPAHKFKHD